MPVPPRKQPTTEERQRCWSPNASRNLGLPLCSGSTYPNPQQQWAEAQALFRAAQNELKTLPAQTELTRIPYVSPLGTMLTDFIAGGEVASGYATAAAVPIVPAGPGGLTTGTGRTIARARGRAWADTPRDTAQPSGPEALQAAMLEHLAAHGTMLPPLPGYFLATQQTALDPIPEDDQPHSVRVARFLRPQRR